MDSLLAAGYLAPTADADADADAAVAQPTAAEAAPPLHTATATAAAADDDDEFDHLALISSLLSDPILREGAAAAAPPSAVPPPAAPPSTTLPSAALPPTALPPAAAVAASLPAAPPAAAAAAATAAALSPTPFAPTPSGASYGAFSAPPVPVADSRRRTEGEGTERTPLAEAETRAAAQIYAAHLHAARKPRAAAPPPAAALPQQAVDVHVHAAQPQPQPPGGAPRRLPPRCMAPGAEASFLGGVLQALQLPPAARSQLLRSAIGGAAREAAPPDPAALASLRSSATKRWFAAWHPLRALLQRGAGCDAFGLVLMRDVAAELGASWAELLRAADALLAAGAVSGDVAWVETLLGPHRSLEHIPLALVRCGSAGSQGGAEVPLGEAHLGSSRRSESQQSLRSMAETGTEERGGERDDEERGEAEASSAEPSSATAVAAVAAAAAPAAAGASLERVSPRVGLQLMIGVSGLLSPNEGDMTVRALHTSAHLCTPLHTSAHLRTPLHTSAHLCAPTAPPLRPHSAPAPHPLRSRSAPAPHPLRRWASSHASSLRAGRLPRSTLAWVSGARSCGARSLCGSSPRPCTRRAASAAHSTSSSRRCGLCR